MHNLINILFVIYIKKNPLTFQGLNKLNQMNYDLIKDNQAIGDT